MQPNSFSTTTCENQIDVYSYVGPNVRQYEFTGVPMWRDAQSVQEIIGTVGTSTRTALNSGPTSNMVTRTVCATQSVVPSSGGGSTGTTTIANAPLESFALIGIWFMVATAVAGLVYLFSR